MPHSALASIVAAIETAFSQNPPTICVVGLSGVGKSSTINSMFGTNRHVSATTRGTTRFASNVFHSISNRVEASPIKCTLRVYDAPGLGEDKTLDRSYLTRYRRHLSQCDIALWIITARNRALALDQQYLEELSGHLPNTVIGMNQVDLVDPIGWNDRINLPSLEQEVSIAAILPDRQDKLSRYAGRSLHVIPYSAAKFYNLQQLFAACIDSAPPHRRWMFELLKGFSTLDWLNKASGMSAAQRLKLASAHIQNDAKLSIDQVLPLRTAT